MLIKHQCADRAGPEEQHTKRSVIRGVVIIALAEINSFDSVFRAWSLTKARERIFMRVPESDATQRKAPLDQNAKLSVRRLLPIEEKHVTAKFIQRFLFDTLFLQQKSMTVCLMGKAAHHQGCLQT
jgi:hypothetical protein